MLHDLSHYLAARGHAVTVFSTAPGERREEFEGDVRRVLLPQRNPLPWRAKRLNNTHLFALQLRRELLQERFDAVHCMNYHDAFGALLARRRASTPRIVYLMAGITMANMFRSSPLDSMMFRAAVRKADAVVSVSRFAQAAMKTHQGRESVLLQAPTDLRPFQNLAKPPPGNHLRILFAGDMNEPRKAAPLLARAFVRIRAVRPEATLVLSGHASPSAVAEIRAQVPADHASALSFVGVGDVEALPRLFSEASVVVNPAAWEAQGMVLVEALAAGTPVVACDHGGVTDIVTDPRIGRLFAPGTIERRVTTNETGLVKAILEAALLSERPETAALCRAHAAQFGWERLGPRYEALITDRPIEACITADGCRMDATTTSG